MAKQYLVGARNRHHSSAGEPLFIRVSNMISAAIYNSVYNFDGHPRKEGAQVVDFSTLVSRSKPLLVKFSPCLVYSADTKNSRALNSIPKV